MWIAVVVVQSGEVVALDKLRRNGDPTTEVAKAMEPGTIWAMGSSREEAVQLALTDADRRSQIPNKKVTDPQGPIKKSQIPNKKVIGP